jgi:hypothetical protein
MTYTRAIWILLAAVVLWYGALEGVTRRVIMPHSRINSKILEEHAAAQHTRPATAKGKTLLIVGNSLLDFGINMPELNQHLAPTWHAQRFMIANTFFLDWYYGLARLFREGARPSAVVVMMSTRQIYSNGTRGEFFAHFLMDPRDIAGIQRDAELHPTNAFGYLVGRASQFYAARSDIRNEVLARLVPGMSDLAATLAPKGSRLFDPAAVERNVQHHLTLLRKLSDEYDIPIILAIPPSTDKTSYFDRGLAAAHAAGLPVLAPVRDAEYPAGYYTDGFHMNETGSHAFTARFAEGLEPMLMHNNPAALAPLFH